MLGLVARVAETGGHVGPDALVLGAHEARWVVAGLDLQLGDSHRLAGSAMGDPGLMPAPGQDSSGPGTTAGGSQPQRSRGENSVLLANSY